MNESFEHTTVINSEFEQQYLLLRKKEGRMYPDDQVMRLPLVPGDHPLRNEWKVRKYSAGKLFAYLEQKQRPLRILEVGCGNGWLSHKLSQLENVSVIGLDVNSVELEQAKRVFENQQLQFVYGDIRHGVFNSRFDVMVFAASLQYFPSLPEVIGATMDRLEQGGEIHILDTHFYNNKEETIQAAKRSKQYFTELGFPLMEQFYFHHSLEDLEGFTFQVLYDPAAFKNRILNQSPFRWIRIKKC